MARSALRASVAPQGCSRLVPDSRLVLEVGAQGWCQTLVRLKVGARRLLGDRTGIRMGRFAPEFHNPLELLLFYFDSGGGLVDARFRSRTISVRYDRKEY